MPESCSYGSDTVSRVIHNQPERAPKAKRRMVVNNTAAAQNLAVGNLAANRTRTYESSPARTTHRTPTSSLASGPIAERTSPHEGHCIRSRPSRSTSPNCRPKAVMKSWNEQTHFAGLDWADDHHDVIVVDAHGQIVLEQTFAHSLEGWQQFEAALKPWPQLPVAIETSSGPVVDQLLQRDFLIYPVMPRAAARYRERKCPTGTKTDHHDAWSLADALRTDGHAWKALTPLDPLTAELRLLCRDEVALIEQRTALVNQLQATLKEYYPAALQAFEDWTQPVSWTFVAAFPTPQALQKAGRRSWEKFLHTHRLWRPQTVEGRLQIFAQATRFAGSAPVTAAKSLLALALVKMLQVLQTQLDHYRQRIQELFNQHPDRDLFGSLPGAGPMLMPRLLSGLSSQDWSRTWLVQAWAGTAPVTYQSGQIKRVKLRRACDHFMRSTLHLWADQSRRFCTWAEAFYQAHRDKGQSHACALRCLAHRWLEIVGAMCRTHKPYDAEHHLREARKHGSWTLQLIQAKSAPAKS